MNKIIHFASLFLVLVLLSLGLKAQVYHEDDKEGLRKFLRQSSAIPGKINLELVPGFTISDTLSWDTSEEWVTKLTNRKLFVWNYGSQSKRLTKLTLSGVVSGPFAGILDCTLFAELTTVDCFSYQLTHIITSPDSRITSMNCSNNLLRFSTLPHLYLSTSSYAYYPQKGFANDTIPVGQIIDLSSEFLIDGTTTTYTWVDIIGRALPANSIESIEDGIFKANAVLVGKTVVCRMNNYRFGRINQTYTITFTDAKPVQIYHEDDKEGLRRFLRQTSAEPGKLNLEVLKLAISDTLNWEISEEWIEKSFSSYQYFEWNEQQPQRLTLLTFDRDNLLSGTLDCTLFTELRSVQCSNQQLTRIIANEDSKINDFDCSDNLLRLSTLPLVSKPYMYFPQKTLPTDTIPIGQIIDLSSEYLIGGLNTEYYWSDEREHPLPANLISSIGNGIFKADPELVGKTVICRMHNKTFGRVRQLYTVTFTDTKPVQIYHEDDKEGLRRFLRQASAEPGKLNLEWMGLAISDTLDWTVSEEWVEKLNTGLRDFCSWTTEEQSKRLTILRIYRRESENKFAGILDCTLFTELISLECLHNHLTSIIVNEVSKILTIHCQNNALRFSTLPLLGVNMGGYSYFPQKALPTDTIPVTQVIDLSSEYQIKGINTVYKWVDEAGASLTLASAGNGIFKADATLGGKTITCRMTNQAFPGLTLEYMVIVVDDRPVQLYHEDDKEGLRRFLRQVSAEPGKINLEMLPRLALSDTLDWNTSEAWIQKLMSNKLCFWNSSSLSPKRLSTLNLHKGYGGPYAGILDCTLFTELTDVTCYYQQFTQIIINEDAKIRSMECSDNLLRFSTLPLLISPVRYTYSPQRAFPTDTISIEQVIDLSSEYLINGTNTVYKWVDEAGAPLTLASAGNGMFKADATLEGRTITCQMTNQTFPGLTLSYSVVLTPALPVQIYHEDDKEGLRRFLRQPSAESGKLNLEIQGLVLSDTLNWEVSEAWVEKLNILNSPHMHYGWDSQQPKRLSYWFLSSNTDNSNLAGILDCTLFAELCELPCSNNQLTRIIASKDSKISWLDCRDNLLRFSTLPLLDTPYYTYSPQGALPTDTIPVTQVIDLSSEYLINGISTIYTWYDEQNNPLTLTSAGNGMFKANAALSGKTITCRMTNQRFPDLTLEYTVTFEEAMPVAYHEADKEGLRRFLRQASAQPGKLNFEAFGLATSDTLQWGTSNEWIEKLNVLNSNNYEYLSWNNQHPKRLSVLRVHYSTSLSYKLAGVLDCSPFTELTRINCNNNLFTQVVVNEDAKISYLNCPNNILRFSTLPLLNKAYIYAPQKAWPTDTIPVAQVIDLSSEYLINGTNTVYQWIDEAGAPLILTSAGNGIFKADTTFEGKTITCHMTNQRFPDLTLEYKIVFIESSPEPEIITLIAHLALEESPEKDYYVASSGQRFKIFAQTLLNPDLVRIGLFKSSNGGAWIEDITQSRSGYTYTCEISQMTATNNYMIQAYTLNENGDIQVIERKAQGFTIDKLPFAFVRNALLKYTPAPETLQSHLVLNSSEKNLYCLYIDNAFKVVVNIPVVGGTRIGLFDLFGELVEDVTESVNGKLFTCRMSYGVFPGNYMLLPYKETAQGIQIIERTTSAAVMDRLPVRVDYEWNLRNSAKSAYSDIAEESEIIIYPNPVQHMLHVKADNAIEQIEIYNLQGKVFKKVIRTSEISVADLPEGMYLIRIYINDTQTSRVFKKE